MLDVHDDVEVIQQRPAAFAGALAAGRLVAGLAHFLLDLVDDGVDLPFVGCRGDHEAVGDDQLLGDVDDDDVVGELGGGRAGGHCRHVDGLRVAVTCCSPRPAMARSLGSPSAVELALGDVLHDAVGHQVPQRPALFGAQAAVGRRDRQRRDLDQGQRILGQLVEHAGEMLAAAARSRAG